MAALLTHSGVPEFKGRDLTSYGPARLAQRAVDGATVLDLPDQAVGLTIARPAVALMTVGGNDLLGEIMFGHDPKVAEFAVALDAFLDSLPLRPVLIGNVYDPTFGQDEPRILGVDPAVARGFHHQVNEAIAAAADRYGVLVDLHAHFLGGDPSWFTQTIEPSLRGASEVRRCFLPHVLGLIAGWGATGQGSRR